MRDRNLRTMLTLASLAMFPAVAHAGDSELSLEPSVRLQPVKPLRLTATPIVRLADYGLSRVMPELEVDYKLRKKLRALTSYRWMWLRDDRLYVENGHQAQLGLSDSWDAGPVELGLRTLGQWRLVTDTHGGKQGDEIDWTWRNRLSVEVPLGAEVAADVGVEHFTALQDGPEHDRWRVSAGTSAQFGDWTTGLTLLHDFRADADDDDESALQLEIRWDVPR